MQSQGEGIQVDIIYGFGPLLPAFCRCPSKTVRSKSSIGIFPSSAVLQSPSWPRPRNRNETTSSDEVDFTRPASSSGLLLVRTREKEKKDVRLVGGPQTSSCKFLISPPFLPYFMPKTSSASQQFVEVFPLQATENGLKRRRLVIED